MHRHILFFPILWFAPVVHSQVVTPLIGLVTPSQVDVGRPAFDLTIDGSGFAQGTVVNWSGTPLSTTFRRAERLIAAVPGNLIVASDAFNLTVTNPGGAVSSPSVFKVQPILTSIYPNSVPLGSPDVTFAATGVGFSPGASLILIGGTSVFGSTSTYVSPTEIQCAVPAALFSAALSILVSVANPSGTRSGEVALSIGNAITIGSVSPSHFTAGVSGVTLTVNGVGFLPGAVVRWLYAYPGAVVETLKTVFVSSTQLQAAVTADQLASPAGVSIRVDNPDGNVSNGLDTDVNSPVADLLSISPDSAVAGAPGFTLTVNGTGFLPNARLMLGITPLPTTYVTATQLTASVPPSAIYYPGKATVSVFDLFNGMPSNQAAFTIAPWIPTVASVVNAASSLPNSAPGSLVSIYGFDFAYLTHIYGLPPNVYPLDVLSATINGKQSPALYFGQNQINAQVPFETQPGTAVLVVTVNGVKSVPASFQVNPTAPGVFTLAQSNHAVAQNNADGKLNSPQFPAKPGDYIIAYLTGQGVVDNPVATGAPTPAAPLSRPLAAVQAKIGGLPAQVSFAGLAPGFIGLLQVNLMIPDVPAGDLPLEVSIGGVSATVTLVSVGGK
ncbi:MAG TPA: hypothetical protein VNY05_00750 [Candidatus Acidoferrales bacterium]|nr:hypothetical protein [Candidatus Acidoferrales bacterium]